MIDPRYPINHPEDLLSPSLLIFREVVGRNIDAMIAMARGADRLRPHVKTHKMPAAHQWLESLGIHKHKCATIAEAEMVAAAGGSDVLIGYPIVGPNLGRFARLVETYPKTIFRATVDHPEPALALSHALRRGRTQTPVLIDLEIGMGRTGIVPGDRAEALYALVGELPHLKVDGLQAYDGQIRDKDPEERRKSAAAGIEAVHALRGRLLASGLPVPRLVLGGRQRSRSRRGSGTPGVGARREPASSTTPAMPKFPDAVPWAAVLYSPES